jgi:PIN domain nuclease of toxin-antitoxin system
VEAVIYLDTHVVVWLFGQRFDLLSPMARSLIEGNDLYISPIVGLELQYLFETRRTSRPAQDLIETLTRDLGLVTCDLPFTEVARGAWRKSWTRDPFDRILVSQARLRGAPLLTKDATIRKRYQDAVWSRPRS